MINKLIIEANDLLKNGGFDYAFCGGQAIDLFLGYESRVHGDIDVCVYWENRNRIIEYMQSKGFLVYEMLGGGRAHRITAVSDQRMLKKNIFCFLEGCPLVKTYPPDEDGTCWMEFFHIGQTELNFIEFLFNDKSEEAFEYARNREIKREIGKAILFSNDIPYLAPEICLLYKAKELDREGYQEDFEKAYTALENDQKEWLQYALRLEYPQGHKWLKEKLYLHKVTEKDVNEVARTWPSDHSPLSEDEAKGVIANMQGNYAKNKKGCIYHLCLALCRESDPGVIMGWCGLDGTRSQTEPELFIILCDEYQNKGYGTWCAKELLRMAMDDFTLQSVHGGCAKDNIASWKAMEKAGMIQYGTEDNGDPVFRFHVNYS